MRFFVPAMPGGKQAAVYDQPAPLTHGFLGR